jgi:Mannosyl-glycoprotein endo-beta-N-acetylglucosaminidase
MKSKCCKSSSFKDQLNTTRCTNCLLKCTVNYNLRYMWIIIFSSILLFGFTVESKAPKGRISKHKFATDCVDSDIQLNDSCILRELIKDNCYFPEIAMKQIHLEANWYNSELVKSNRNLFGLKCSCKYSKGIKNKHSYYNSYKDCIKCYVDFHNKYWQKYCKNYAEDSLYIYKLKKIN